MVTEHSIYDETYQGYGDLRSNQFYTVEFQAAKIVQRCSSTVAVVCGILQNNPNSGESAVVRHLGKSKFASHSGAYGNFMGPAANGALNVKVAGSASGQYIILQAIQASDSGDIVMGIVSTPRESR